MRPLLERIRREEGGAVIVTVAVFLPVAIALAAFVIDVGNAMEHRRHLQLQADASAYAAAQEFNACGNNPEDANEAIAAAAIEYAGSPRNVLLGDDDAQGRVKTVINGTDYDAEDNSLGTPCDTGFVDVKLTEEESPAFFDFVGDHDYRARARIQVFKVQQLNGLLPVALPVPDFENAAAIFVNEATGLPLKDSSNNDVIAPLQETSDGTFESVTSKSVPIPTDADHVGVRIALSNGTSTDCTASGVVCYDAGSANGLVHIQGWTAAGTVTYNGSAGPQTAPLVRSVTLQPGTNCDNPYFSSATEPCDSIKVRATVDFGGDPTALGASVTAIVDGNDYPLTLGASGWESGAIDIPTGAGPIDVELEWEETDGGFDTGNATAAAAAKPDDKPDKPPKPELDECNDRNNNPCKGTFGFVQRHFSAVDDRSGPIESVRLKQGSTDFPNSLQRCSTGFTGCTYPLDVSVELSGLLEVNGPAQYLRVDGGNLTQALDCNADGPGNFSEEIVIGCMPWYEVNDGTPCPASVAGTPQPWKCSQVAPGERESQLGKALNLRILGDEKPDDCTASNNYPSVVTGDPRIVQVYLTEFGAFDETGADDTVPVTGFATFYITGWKGNTGFANPCEGNGDETPPGAALEVGELLGHFIPYVNFPNDGGAGTNPCDFDDPRPCTAVLTE